MIELVFVSDRDHLVVRHRRTKLDGRVREGVVSVRGGAGETGSHEQSCVRFVINRE